MPPDIKGRIKGEGPTQPGAQQGRCDLMWADGLNRDGVQVPDRPSGRISDWRGGLCQAGPHQKQRKIETVKRNRENGQKGGCPRKKSHKNPVGFEKSERLNPNPKKADNENDNEIDDSSKVTQQRRVELMGLDVAYSFLPTSHALLSCLML